MSYAELQVTTHFSFLRGASSAQELFETAKALGIEALGVVYRNSPSSSRSIWLRSTRYRTFITISLIAEDSNERR